jgi:hypothetical protein
MFNNDSEQSTFTIALGRLLPSEQDEKSTIETIGMIANFSIVER